MRIARICVGALGGLLAAAGALCSVALASGDGVPVNEVAISVVVTAYAVVATVIVLARPTNRVGWLMWLGALAWGVGEGLLALGVRGFVTDPGSVPGAEWLGVLGSAARGFGWLVLVIGVALIFPNGRTPWPGRRWPLVIAGGCIGTFTLATLLSPSPLESRLADMDSPTGLPADLALVSDLMAVSALALATVALGAAVVGLVGRWRRGDELERQQLTWFAAAFACPVLFLPFIATTLVEPWMFAVVTVPVPLAVGAALLQRRLYDIQLVLSRSLTYLALWCLIAVLYAVTVGGVGALLRERGADWLPWVAAGVVAVTFAPLRHALQQAANKLVYGQWSQPADVLAATGRRLVDAADVPALLRTLTEELVVGLRLRHVAVTDTHGRPLAAYGTPAGEGHRIDLMAYGRSVGVLVWSGPPLRDPERRLLDDIARQLGAVVHAAGLLGEIRSEQERLVLAREEERRRLRRDLHDGLGPALGGLTLQVDTLRNRVGSPELDTDVELLRLRDGIQATVHDVRRIVEGLRPPALDELGLVGAIDQLADRLAATTELSVTVDSRPVPTIPAAVEVAAYRVAQEALTNAVRHSGADQAAVRIALDGDSLHVLVQDDGAGGACARPGGVGLESMRERAEEIGGTLHISSRPGWGTAVDLRLPLAGQAIGS